MLNNDKQDKAFALSERPWYQRSVAEIFSELQSSSAGLSTATAQERLQKHGPNALPQKLRNRLCSNSSRILKMC